MAIDPEELLPRPKKPALVVGEDLSALSVAELEHRIKGLEADIQRHREAIAARNATKSAADAVFKR